MQPQPTITKSFQISQDLHNRFQIKPKSDEIFTISMQIDKERATGSFYENSSSWKSIKDDILFPKLSSLILRINYLIFNIFFSFPVGQLQGSVVSISSRLAELFSSTCFKRTSTKAMFISKGIEPSQIKEQIREFSLVFFLSSLFYILFHRSFSLCFQLQFFSYLYYNYSCTLFNLLLI